MKELMGVAKRNRWQTCPNCKEIVELDQGCYHITYVLRSLMALTPTNSLNRCRCRHQFCYLCVAEWKTCGCPVWDERNIIDAAAPINDQAAAAPAANAAPAPFVNPAPNLQPVAVNPARNVPHMPLGLGYPAPIPVAGPFPAPFVPRYPAPFAAPLAAPFAAPYPATVHPQMYHQAAAYRHNGNRRGLRQQNYQDPHEHDFVRYYRSMDWDTECHLCGHSARWVNCCSGCDLKVCWYCTKHRT